MQFGHRTHKRARHIERLLFCKNNIKKLHSRDREEGGSRMAMTHPNLLVNYI